MNDLFERHAVDCEIIGRRTREGHPFTEVLIKSIDGAYGEYRSCSRFWYSVTDTPHARACEMAAFDRRQRGYARA